MDKQANIILKTPRVSSRYVKQLLDDKEPWIRKKIKNLESNPAILLNLDEINSISSKEYLKNKVDYFSNIMNLKYNELKFRKMKSRWGSCTSNGIITLNKKLIKTPEKCIDYVVVHELAHLVHMNHSKKFHKLILNYIPDAKRAKDILSRVVFI